MEIGGAVGVGTAMVVVATGVVVALGVGVDGVDAGLQAINRVTTKKLATGPIRILMSRGLHCVVTQA